MESGQGVAHKGRKLASSRRRQMREPAVDQDTPVASEPESWSSQAAAELRGFFQVCGAEERGFITREDLAEAKFHFLGDEEDLQMIFDWMDTERRGRLSLEEFSSGLKNVFGYSRGTRRPRRKRPPSSSRLFVDNSFSTLEEANNEEKEAFSSLLGQLGTSHSLTEQAEAWQLWGELKQEEPQLAGNLEGFLAKMSRRLQEARADREALERTLTKRASDHRREVQQLYEEAEEQIRREKEQLHAQSDSRGLALSAHMQEALEAKEQEVQRLVEGQRELEAHLHHLSSTQQAANSENQQLREAKEDLAGQLEEVWGRLQVTRGHLEAARGKVSWQVEEGPSVPRASKKDPDPQAVPPEEAPLPGLFGDNDDWDQFLSNFRSPPHGALQLSWSPPPTPSPTSSPQKPRVVRQISISKPFDLFFGQETTSDPEGTLSSSSGVPSRAKDGKEVRDPEGQDGHPQKLVGHPSQEARPEGRSSPPKPVETPSQEARPEGRSSPEQPVEPPGPEVKSKAGAEVQESGGLGAAASRVLLALELSLPPQGDSPPLPQGRSAPPQVLAGPSKQFKDPSDKHPWPGPIPAKPPRLRDPSQDLNTTGSEPSARLQGAPAPTENSAEPPQGLMSNEAGASPVGRARKPGPAKPEDRAGRFQEAHVQTPRLDGLLSSSLLSPEQARAEQGVPVGRGQQAAGLETEHPESPLQDAEHERPLSDTSLASATAPTPDPGKPSSPRDSPPSGVQSGTVVGPPESMHTLPTLTEPKAQTGTRPTPAQAQRELGSTQPSEPGAYNSAEAPGAEAALASSLGNPMADKPPADPDYLFHVIFVGDSNVGKTSFLHLLHCDTFATGQTATVGVDFRVKSLQVDNRCFALQLWDTAGQERYHSLTRQLLRKAEGVVLMYDVTSHESFAHVRYWLDCLQDAGADGAVVILLGNKMDCEEERQVPTEAGRQLAQELGITFSECSAALGHNILEPIVTLARSLKMQEDRLKVVTVAPQQPPKRSGCCS